MKIIRPALNLAAVGATSIYKIGRNDDPPCCCYSRDCSCDRECSCDNCYCSKDY